jgi:hypothetical protein
MPITLRKELGGDWETIRGFLKDDLDAIEQQLNLPIDLTEVTGNIPASALPDIAEGTLLGRGEGEGTGPAEEITLGAGLAMTGTVLSVNLSTLGGALGRNGRDGEDGRRGVPGAKGDKGDRGPMGQPGRPGEDGRDGRIGLQGVQGLIGPMGPPGRPGRDGERGLMGPPGADGSGGTPFDPATLYWDLLTNGDADEPELIFLGGDVIWVPVV